MKKRIPILGFIMLGGVAAGGWIGGCIDRSHRFCEEQRHDRQVSIGLQVGVGVTLNTVTYTITGPAGFSRTGSIDVSHSSTVSAVISGIPFGTGYQIALARDHHRRPRRLHGLGDVRRHQRDARRPSRCT